LNLWWPKELGHRDPVPTVRHPGFSWETCGVSMYFPIQDGYSSKASLCRDDVGRLVGAGGRNISGRRKVKRAKIKFSARNRRKGGAKGIEKGGFSR